MSLETDVEKEYELSSRQKIKNLIQPLGIKLLQATGPRGEQTVKYVVKKTRQTSAAVKRYPSNFKKYLPQSSFSALFLSGVKVPVEMYAIPDFTVYDNVSMTLGLSALALFTFPIAIDIIEKPVKSTTTYLKNIPITQKTRQLGRLSLAFAGTLAAKVGIYSGYFDHPLEESFMTGLVVAAGVTYLTDMIPKFYENSLLRNRLIGLSVLSVGLSYGLTIDRTELMKNNSLDRPSHIEYKLDSIPKNNILLKNNLSSTNNFYPLSSSIK